MIRLLVAVLMIAGMTGCLSEEIRSCEYACRKTQMVKYTSQEGCICATSASSAQAVPAPSSSKDN